MNPKPTSKVWRVGRWFLPSVFLVFPIVLNLAIVTSAVGEHGRPGDLWGQMFFVLGLLLLALLALVAGIPLVFFKKTRVAAILTWLCALACLFGLTVGSSKSWEIERKAYLGVSTRSKPLVEAIRAFEMEFGQPPDTLDQLVPRFLGQIPFTGMGACPKYELVTGEAARRHDGNPWVLRIRPPQAGIGFDEFLYYPLQNYPDRGVGGAFERIGDWVYVHE